jgi:RNA polymerase sigma factor (sigma-70 family)
MSQSGEPTIDDSSPPNDTGARGLDAAKLNQHRPVLRAFFARRARVAADADDHVQEVFARALAAVGTTEIRNGSGFLLRIASNYLIDQKRRSDARARDSHLSFDQVEEPADETPSPERIVASRQQLQAVDAALRELDPDCREAFRLARVDGLSHQEIAQQMDLDVPRVRRLVEKAVLHLTRRMLRP